MDATTPQSADLQRQQDRKRKRKALLAGGVVLGLGAAATLAAWSDDVFANGFFETGTFELEGTADGTTWAEHDSGGDAAALFFNTTASSATNASSLQYNETVWAPLTVRLTDDTTVDGTYVLTGVTMPDSTSGLNGALDFVVQRLADRAACVNLDDGAPGAGTNWYTGTVGGAVTPATAEELVANATGTPGDSDFLCLGITLNSNDQAFMGQDATEVQWQFTATADTA